MNSNVHASGPIVSSVSYPSFEDVRKKREAQTSSTSQETTIQRPLKTKKELKRPPPINTSFPEILQTNYYSSGLPPADLQPVELSFLRSQANLYYNKGPQCYEIVLNYIAKIVKINPNDCIAASLKARIRFEDIQD